MVARQDGNLRGGGTPRAQSEPSYLQAYMTRCVDRLHPEERKEHVDSLTLALTYYQQRLGLYVSRLGYEAATLVYLTSGRRAGMIKLGAPFF